MAQAAKDKGAMSKQQQRRDKARPEQFRGPEFVAEMDVKGEKVPICWGFNLGTCLGLDCPRGKFMHACCRAGCNGKHPAITCPRK